MSIMYKNKMEYSDAPVSTLDTPFYFVIPAVPYTTPILVTVIPDTRALEVSPGAFKCVQISIHTYRYVLFQRSERERILMFSSPPVTT